MAGLLNLVNIRQNLPRNEATRFLMKSAEHSKINLSESMEVEEFLTVPEEGVVYGVTDDNQIITELAEIF